MRIVSSYGAQASLDHDFMDGIAIYSAGKE